MSASKRVPAGHRNRAHRGTAGGLSGFDTNGEGIDVELGTNLTLTDGVLDAGSGGGAPARILGRCDPVSTIVASSSSGHIRRAVSRPTVVELAPLAWADAANAITSVPTGWTLAASTALTSAAISSGEMTIVHNNSTADNTGYGSGTATAPHFYWSTTQPTGTTVQVVKLRSSAGDVGNLQCSWGYVTGRLTMGFDLASASASDWRIRVLVADAAPVTLLTGQSQATATTGWWVRLVINWLTGTYRIDYATASGAVPTTEAGWTFGVVGTTTEIVSNSRNGSWVFAMAIKRTSGTGMTGHVTFADEYVVGDVVREATHAPWRSGGLTMASDTLVFGASIDCGVARLPDQAAARAMLADAENRMPGDAATWTWSITGSASANPGAATTFQAASALTLKQAGSDTAASGTGYRYWAIRAKAASSGGTQSGSVDTALVQLVA